MSVVLYATVSVIVAGMAGSSDRYSEDEIAAVAIFWVILVPFLLMRSIYRGFWELLKG